MQRYNGTLTKLHITKRTKTFNEQSNGIIFLLKQSEQKIDKKHSLTVNKTIEKDKLESHTKTVFVKTEFHLQI